MRKYCCEGLEQAITDRKRKGRPTKLQGKQKAHLIALACSNLPEERRCWTMQLLAQKCIELNLIDFISDDTVSRVLKKRDQALANKELVHPGNKRRVCLSNGRSFGLVRGAI